MTASLLLSLESALVAHLGDGRLPFASSVVGSSAPSVSDEDRYGILGQYVALPAVIVAIEEGEQDFPDNPCLDFPVKVTVRDSQFQVSVATHKAHASTVANELWDKAALAAGIGLSSEVALSGVIRGGESFRKENAALVTEFNLKIMVSSKN